MNILKTNSLPRFANFIGVVSIFFIVISRFWKLDRGLIFSDEGWYVTLLRDNPAQSLQTRFHKLFQFGLQNDIYGMRLVLYALLLAAIMLFGYSVYTLQKSKGLNNSFLNCLSFVALGSLQAHSISTPNYINLNLLFGLLAISFCLFYVSSKKNYYVAISAFFASFLFTTQVLGIVIIPLLYLVIIFSAEKKISVTISFVIGILLFFCVFFGLIESPKELIGSVVNQTQDVVSKQSGDYGIFFLVKWSITSLSYIIKFLIAALLFYQGAKWFKQKQISAKWMYLVYTVMFIAIIGYFNVFVNPHCHASSFKNFNQLGIPYFLSFLFIVEGWEKLNKESYLVLLLLLFTPFALCLGTNTEFLARYSTFLVFLLPVIFVFSKPNNTLKVIALVYFAITLFVSIFSVNKANWLGERPSDQNIPVKTIGINQKLKLTERNIKQLEFCQQSIEEGTICYSSTKTWGIVALLGLKPASYSWKLPQADVMSSTILEQIPIHKIVVISSEDEKFNHDELVLPDNVEHQTISQDGVYLDYYSMK